MNHSAADCNGTKGLTPRQRRAVGLLAQGLSITAVAEQVPVNRVTLYRWRATVPEFSLALETALRQREGEASYLLRQATVGAVERLRDLLRCGNPSVELGAAKALIQAWERAVERRMAEQDLAELREQLEELRAVLERAGTR